MSRRNTWPTFVIIIVALAAWMAGCERTNISDISKHPQDFAGYEVTIAGQVTASGGTFKMGTFEVDDGSGRLWVISNTLDLPAQGSHVAVTGMVEPGVQLGSNALPAVLQEISRYRGGG